MFKALFGIITALTVWFVGDALSDLIQFYRLDRQAPAHIHKWRLCEPSNSKYAFKLSYTFEAEGKKWKGKTVFSKPYYLNLISAEKALKQEEKNSHTVWYSASQPTLNSLQKNFPCKKSFYALTMVGLAIYFWRVKRIS